MKPATEGMSAIPDNFSMVAKLPTQIKTSILSKK